MQNLAGQPTFLMGHTFFLSQSSLKHIGLGHARPSLKFLQKKQLKVLKKCVYKKRDRPDPVYFGPIINEPNPD